MVPSKAWNVESVFRFLLNLLIAFLVLGVVAYLAERLLPGPGGELRQTRLQVIGTLVFQLATFFLVGWFLRENTLTWEQAFGISAGRWGRNLLFAGAAILAVLPVCYGLIWVVQKLLEWQSITPDVQTMVKAVQQATTWDQRALLGFTAIALAPVWEELVFRGILFTVLRQAGFPRLAWWASSLLFATIHWNLLTFLPLLLFGAVMIWLYERTENLLTPIAAHALFNALNFVWMLLGGPLV